MGYRRNVLWMLLVVLFWACDRCMEPCVHGTCKKKTCQCDSWWEGDGCDRSQLKRFEGQYLGNAPCDDPGGTKEFSLTVDPEVPDRMWLAGDELYLDFTTSVRFDVPLQVWRGQTVEGEGQMLINKVSFHYSDTGTDTTCLIEADLQDN